MPWSGSEFASRHNHALHGAKAEHASHIANAVLRSGVPEGEAIAIANKWAMKHHAMGGPIGYDGGGMVDPLAGSVAINQPTLGAMTPSPGAANPLVAQSMQRYQQMPAEKLQEMEAMAGNSPQGAMIRRALMQKRMMPQQQPTQISIASQAMGGPVQHRMGGGMLGMGLSEAEPWWTRAEARSADAPMSGYLHGATAGRADALKGTAMSDSYILPAEEIAGLGEGNSLMGARVIQAMLGSGPHGIPQERGHAGRGPPHPPSMQEPRAFQAKGGGVQHADQPTTKVALSHGEYSLSPEEVATKFGDGDLKRGHRVLDLFVQELRRRHIKELAELKPPVGAKKA